MKKIYYIFYLLLIVSCKTPQEKAKTQILENIDKYNAASAEITGMKVSNCILVKLDTIDSTLEKIIISNNLKEKINIYFQQKLELDNKIKNSDLQLKSAQDINRTTNFQTVVDHEEYNNHQLNNDLTSVNQMLEEYDKNNNKLVIEIEKEIRSKNKNKTILGYIANVTYDVELPDTSTKKVENVLILDKDFKIQDQDSYIENIKKKYLPKDF